LRGDVFQIVLSRRFQQKFIGDEFNVYRALRSINLHHIYFILIMAIINSWVQALNRN